MSKRKIFVAALLCANISFAVFTSCVDDSYDLSKDIDMTVNVGGNIVVPGSGTEEIKLSEIMDLDTETSIIKTNENGDYELRKSETQNSTKATIDPVVIEAKTTDETTEQLDFNAPTSIGERITSEVDDNELDFTYENYGVTIALKALYSAEVDMDATLKLSFDNAASNVDALYLNEGFTIEFRMENQTSPDNMVMTVADKDNFEIVEVNGVPTQTIRFRKEQKIEKGGTLSIPVHVSRVQNFPEGQGLISEGVFKLTAQVLGRGTATIIGQEMKDVSLTLKINSDFKDVSIISAYGIADPDIDIEDEIIEVTGIPDFLADENTVLDFKNPVFTLEIDNPSPFIVNLNADIYRIKENEAVKAPLTIGLDINDPNDDDKIIFDKENKSIYYLSRLALPQFNNPSNHQYNKVLGEGIYELIRTIPDKLELTNINAKALQVPTTFKLGNDVEEYQVTTTYSIISPLQFGPDVHIEYNDTMADWSDDLEDFTIKQAIVTMDAENGIPLDFSMSAKAVDKNGNECKNIKVEIINGNIEAGYKTSGTGNAVNDAKNSHVEMVLTCESEDMKELDGLAIKFVAENKSNKYPDVILNENMTLRLSNIRFAIKNGITIDLN